MMLIYIGLMIAMFLTTSALSQNIFSVDDLFDYSYGNCEYRELENGRVFPEEVTYAPFSRVGYVCNKGYKLLGPDTASCVQGSWSARLPYCAPSFKSTSPPLTCPYRSLPNGRVVPQKSTYNIGNRVRFSCSSGYNRVGILVSECLDDGTWGSSVPICRKSEKFSNPETHCPMPKFPRGSYSPKPLNSKSYLPGSAIEFTCKSNYYIKGSKTAICLKNGKWNQTPKCETGCKKPVIENGYFAGQLSGLYFAPGQKVTFGCKPTYKIRGETSAICRKNGRWSVKLPIKVLPKCTLRSSSLTSGCRLPKLPPGLILINQKKEVYPFKAQLEFKCMKGYNLIGSAVSICRKHFNGGITGGLDPALPSCEAHKCGSPGKPQNGRFRDGQKDAYYVGDVVHFVCDDRYIMTGSSSITCQENGQFSGLTPTCAPPSCKQGCDYILRRECQCDIKCGDRGDCCHDFDQLCRHLFY